TNVTNFGAFVDIGVHQDGLVHISSLSNRYVEDPRQVVKTGDIVQVKVLEVDLPRKRIALTMRLDEQPGDNPVRRSTGAAGNGNKKSERPRHKSAATPAMTGNSAMGDALAAALKKR
ncbi:MAG: S1 RNA-binding domain-containing protein, partial [Enterobacteriaceae bacterium]